jgi:hydroxyacylglutathione hydrolase
VGVALEAAQPAGRDPGLLRALSNIKFAQTIEPSNPALIARAAEAADQVKAKQPTIPTTIAEEKAANPFLRADVQEVAAAVGMAGKPAAAVFAEIRARKNKF